MYSFLKNLLPVYKRDPFFLIIGAQKAGTTALFSYLSQHPMIVPAERKEIHFFSNDGLFEKGLQYYRRNFPKVKNKVTFEVSPSYLMSPSAPERIFNYNKQIKLIVILRDPVLRAYSAWNMYRERYRKNRSWFYDDWLKNVNGNPKDFERRDDKTLYDFKVFVLEEIEHRSQKEKKIEAPVLPQGFYARYLKRYFSLFPREQVLVLENSELLNHTVDVLKRVEDFLNIPAHAWVEEDLTPVFTGKYHLEKPQEAFKLLYEFYFPYNEELVDLLGIHYDWNVD